MRLAVIDGSVRHGADAVISVFDRGLLLGDAAFETLRARGRRALELDAHLDRLEHSAALLALTLPCPRSRLAEEVLLGVESGGHAESTVRVLVTRGEGPPGLDPTEARHPRRLVLVEPYRPVDAERLRRGLSLRSRRIARTVDSLPGAKLTSYVTSIVATREVRLGGDDEALLLDAGGDVLEGTSFNVFAITNEELVTPPAGPGVLGGITRGVVLELARNLGLPAAERPLPFAALRAADEAFVTSTLRELVPVSRVDGAPLRTVAGPLTRRLHEAYRRRIGAPPPPYESA